LGLIHYNNFNDVDSAIKFLSKALELNPADGYASLIRGYCYKDKGDYIKALNDLKMAKKDSSD
jgi:tetratricopeptide (TPR) repeat protein